MIKKIIIEIDKKEITLTPKQAEKLFDELGKLYGKEKEYVHYYPCYPNRTYPPYYIGDYWYSDGTSNVLCTNGDDDTDTYTITC